MSKYDPLRIKQLIELSCWLSKVEPNVNGFEKIVQRIENGPKKERFLTPKYLQNLWGEASNAILSETSINKDDNFILELLDYCEYSTWESFILECDTIASHLRPVAELTGFEKIEASILAEEKEIEELRPWISFSAKIVDFSVQLIPSESSSLELIESMFDHSAYIISYLSPDSDQCAIHPINEEKFEKLKSLSRYVPVWSGKLNGFYQIRGIKKHELILGKRGVLLGLLIISEFKDKIPTHFKATGKSNKIQSAVNKIGKFSGLISGGDIHVSGKNIALRDSHKHIYKKTKE